jgi:MFS family permease
MGLFTRYPVFALSNLAALLQYAAVFAVALLISQYLQNLRGLDARQAGLVLLAQPVTMMVTAPVAGRLSDRFGPRLLASGGLGVTTVVLLGLTRLGPGMGLWAVAAMLAVLGVGMGLFSSPNVNAIMGAIDRQYFGVGAATLGTMRLTGQMASMAIVQLVFGLHLGSAAIGPETQGGFLAAARTDFFVFAALAGAAMAASLARGQAGHGQADQRAPLGRS